MKSDVSKTEKLKSHWTKWITQPGNIRVVAIEASQLLAFMIKQQGLEGLAQKGYAEAVVGSLLISSQHKSNESINMNAQGSGPYKTVIVDASPEGKVRAFMVEQKDASRHSFGSEGLNGPWGSGVLSILYTKNFEGKQPYKGMVAISTGYMDEAINDYYRDSEQLLSKVGLFVEFRGSELTDVRGALVQVLGGASATEQKAVEDLDIKQMRALAEKANDSTAFIEMAKSLLGELNFQSLEDRELTHFCTCSQERIENAMLLTGEEDAMHAIGDEAVMKITCDFCKTEYKVSRERLRALFAEDPSRLQ